MESISAWVLTIIATAILATLVWVSLRQKQPAGLWWAGAGTLLTIDGLMTLVPIPALLAPYSTHFSGAFATWLLYRGCRAYAKRPAHPAAAILALSATLAWIGLQELGAARFTFYASAVASIPLLVLATTTLLAAATTTMGRLFAYSIVGMIGLFVAFPGLEGSGLTSEGVAELWLAAVCPIGLLATCLLLESHMLETHHALLQTGELLRLGTQVAGFGTWTLDPATRQHTWSEDLYPIFGMTLDMPVPSQREMLGMISEEDREAVSAAVGEACRGERELDIEYRTTTPDRKTRYVRSRAQLIEAPDARRLLIGTTVDVTAHRNALEELRRYRTHLEEIVEQRTAALEASQQQLVDSRKLASIGTLTAGLAHQINNPVGSILAAAGYARHCEGDADEIEILRAAARDIEQEATRCGDIVRDMLRFASNRPTDKKLISIDPILERVRHAFRRVEQETGASLELDLRGPAPRINASAIELEQALTNLVENALQSSHSGARVVVERSETGDQVRVAVRDDGRGIPAKDLPHVLDPFFTSRPDHGGTGLGLSVAHGIAREHGGTLTIASEEGRGTIAVLSIPIAS